MIHDTKRLLQQINDISRQILSHILSVENKIKENLSNQNNNNQTTESSSLDRNLAQNNISEEQEISKLMSQREQLINFLFEQKTQEEISAELDLLNEMASLDTQLTAHSLACKKALTEQLIKFKKSKKIKKSYQKP